MPSHKLKRFTSSVFDVPQYISIEKYKEVAEYLDARNEGLLELRDNFANESLLQRKPSVENGVGTLSIEGVITAKPTGWEAFCGGTNYEQLIADMDHFVKEGVKTVFMSVDSGGGAAHRCMETARLIRRKADDNGIKLVAYVDGDAGSAAYALSSVAHELISNPTSKVGSIGCVISLINDSKKLEKEGYKRIFLASTKGKVPLDDEGEFKEDFLSSLQEDVSVMHQTFVDHVSAYRGIEKDDIESMHSQMFRSDVALESGLIDKVMETEDFYNYLATGATSDDSLVTETLETQNKSGVVMTDTKTEVEAVDTAPEQSLDVNAQLAAMQEKMDALMEQNVLLAEQAKADLEAKQEALAAKEAELKAIKLAEFESEASAWTFANVDTASYAEHALGGNVPLSMFQEAMKNAATALDTSAGMEELGASDDVEADLKEEPEVDGVEAALLAKGKIKS